MGAPPSFSFKHQKTPSTRSVPLGDVTVSLEPLVVDFSSTYPNNQESTVEENVYTVDDQGDVNISGIVGNFIFTDKYLSDLTPLYYEYQPRFDVISSGILLLNEDGEKVPYQMEFAYVSPSGLPATNAEFNLSRHSELDFDTLNGHSDLGIPSGIITFAPVASPAWGLGYETHADSLAGGRLTFSEWDDTDMPSSGILDFTYLSESDSVYRETLMANDWAIWLGSGQAGLVVNGVDSTLITGLHDDSWYRGRMTYNTDLVRLELFREAIVGTTEVAQGVTASGFSADCESLFLNHLTLYREAPTYDWYVPPVMPRYHHALRWQSYPVDPSSDHYRARILTNDSDQKTIIYDAYKPDGTIVYNMREPVNHLPLYKETVTETHEWAVENDITLVLNGPPAQASTITLKRLYTGFIRVAVIDNQVVVYDGSFRSDPFVEGDGKYTYELLEYDDMMPFEADELNLVTPKTLKESRHKATVVDGYKIKVLPMVVHEGRYPNYTPPLTKDSRKVVSGGVVTSATGELSNIHWRRTRGIRVYVNGKQLHQTDIKKFDFDEGYIYLGVPVKPEDNVEVTFLRVVDYFICNYPRLKQELRTGMSWRIYLRANYANNFLDNPTDTLERLAYRTLENGAAVGTLKSCVSGDTVSEFGGMITLADVSLVPTINVTDARAFGGGLVGDETWDNGELERAVEYASSMFSLDIGNVQSEVPS